METLVDKKALQDNHWSLVWKYALEQSISALMQHKQLAKLIGYDYENIYKSDRDNKVVDALSRVHKKEEEPSIMALCFPIVEELSILQNEWKKDTDIATHLRNTI